VKKEMWKKLLGVSLVCFVLFFLIFSSLHAQTLIYSQKIPTTYTTEEERDGRDRRGKGRS
jgi:hypothetical protein